MRIYKNLKLVIDKLANWILDFLFPRFCLGCGKEGFYICENCFQMIPILKHTHCFICGRRSPTGQVCQGCRTKKHPALAGLFVASDWQNPLFRKMIYEYKYRFVKELLQPLGKVLVNFLEFHKLENLPAEKIILIPVPLHKRRQIWRGFNQAELLAKQVSGYFNIPIFNNALERSRHTEPQIDIKNLKERQKNIKQAFKAINPPPQNLQGKIILLVDDVSTTGSTLEECAKTLKLLKPKSIWGLVLARG